MLAPQSSSPFELPSGLPEGLATLIAPLRERIAKLEVENDTLKAENDKLKEQVLLQAETLQAQRDEIAVLKGQKARPRIKPSRMDQDAGEDKPEDKDGGKRPGSKKVSKTALLVIHEDRTVKPAEVPPGSYFLGYNDFTVQDLVIQAHNVRYRLERWRTPEGRVLTAKLPAVLDGQHFGSALRAFVLYQHHHCHVPQPKLLEQLREWGVDISTGQVDLLLRARHDDFAAEKSSVLQTGLAVSSALTVDDSGARHKTATSPWSAARPSPGLTPPTVASDS